MSFTPKIKRAITTPILKLENNVPVYIKIQGEIFKGKGLDGREAPNMVRAINLCTGELCEVILPTIAYNELTDNYPTVDGKCFALAKRALDGKKYNAVDLAEIEDPAAGAETAEQAAAANRSMATGKARK